MPGPFILKRRKSFLALGIYAAIVAERIVSICVLLAFMLILMLPKKKYEPEVAM